MAPYIFMEKNGIHIIDLNKTLACLEEASNAIKQIVRSGKKVMFVATKKQAKDPRFVMALSKDIKPGQVGKEANKMALKTDSQGHPDLPAICDQRQ